MSDPLDEIGAWILDQLNVAKKEEMELYLFEKKFQQYQETRDLRKKIEGRNEVLTELLAFLNELKEKEGKEK